MELLRKLAENVSVYGEVKEEIGEFSFLTKEEQWIVSGLEKALTMGSTRLETGHLATTGMSEEAILAFFAMDVKESLDYYKSAYLYRIKEKKRSILLKEYQVRIEKASGEQRVALTKELVDQLASLDYDSTTTTTEYSIGEIASEMYQIQNINPPISTGYAWLDELLGGGLYQGLPYLFMGETGNGKSTLMKCCSLIQAVKPEYGGRGLNVLVISQELTKEYLTTQYLTMLDADMDSSLSKWRPFNVSENKMMDVRTKALKLATVAPGLVIDDSSYSPEKLARKIKDSVGRFDVIWVDYFQALEVPAGITNEASHFNRSSRIITQAVKEAKEIAVCVLSQITTPTNKKAVKPEEHMTANARYAKQLIQDAAAEIIVFKDEKTDEPDFEGTFSNIYIRKNRNNGEKQEVLTRKPVFPNKGIIGIEWAPPSDIEDAAEEKCWLDFDNLPDNLFEFGHE